MKVAVIGSGGREHAIAWKLAQTESWDNIFTLPGNGGIPNSHAIDTTNFAHIETFCRQKGIELIVVGPEIPLSAGIVDYFRTTDILILGPTKQAALLEGSKIWAKQFMQKHKVTTAASQTFTNSSNAYHFIQSLNNQCVIKYDGLAAGKGVFVCYNTADVTDAFNELEAQYGKQFPFLVEELLLGDEISIIGITDGNTIQLLQPSQDHKQLLDNDLGPNTGGMGAFCPVPFCNDALMQQIKTHIVSPTLNGLQAEGLDYKGFIYFGLMITPTGPKALEYNARLGDPETEVILPSLKSDLLPLVLACLNGTLSQHKLQFHEGFFVDVVLTSGGYPKQYSKGYPISGLDTVGDEVLVFHAGTDLQNSQIVTNGGRVLNIVGQGSTLNNAIAKAYEGVAKISFKDAYYRKDIGQRKSSN
ncbi:MAG: phosphoribosylamine--glycine ligase [Sphingobacteriales bacterium]|nr:phosphoribosylamine--glycine ligase [Sphingobacteriales bacterium]